MIINLLCFDVKGQMPIVSQANVMAQDTAWQSILNLPDDSLKVETMRDYGIGFEELERAKAFEVYTAAIGLSEKIKNKVCEVGSLISMGILYSTHTNYDSARWYYRQALQRASAAKNELLVGKCYINLGNTFNFQYNYDSCVHYYTQSLAYFEKTNNHRFLSITYGNIASVFKAQQNWADNLSYSKKAIASALIANDDGTLANAYNNMAVVYSQSSGYEIANKADSMLHYAHLSLALFKKVNELGNMALLYRNIGIAYFDKGDAAKALFYLDSALVLSRKLENSNGIGLSLVQKSIVYLSQKDITRSAEAIGTAKPFVEVANDWFLWREWYLQISEVREAQGQFRESLAFLKQYYTYKDSISSDDIKLKTKQLEAKYQAEKKQSQIIQLQADKKIQQQTLWFLALALAAASAIGFLIFLNAQRRKTLDKQTLQLQEQRIRELEQEKQIVAMNSILEGQETERSRVAKDLHDGLGGMLSGIKLNLSSMKGNVILQEHDALLFTRSVEQLDAAISEMRRVAHNMMPEALIRFGIVEAIQDFCEGINQAQKVKMKFFPLGMEDANLPQTTTVILYRIIQELTNNALKHAQAQNILVQINKHAQGLTLTVEDDGRGFDANQVSFGAGLHNIQARVDYLKGSLEIDTRLGSGSSFTIEIPD